MSGRELAFAKLEQEALAADKRRARVNYHRSERLPLQAMHVCLERSTKILPHMHEENRMEFYYALTGEAYFVEFYKSECRIRSVVFLSAREDRHHYNRSASFPHLLIPQSPFFHFLEASNGSFDAAPQQPKWYLDMTGRRERKFWSDVAKALR